MGNRAAAARGPAAGAPLRQEVARLRRSADPRLPAPADSLLATVGEPPDGCDDPMIVPGPGRPVAVGTCRHDRVPADSMEILWRACRARACHTPLTAIAARPAPRAVPPSRRRSGVHPIPQWAE